jgi:hypothetical protein
MDKQCDLTLAGWMQRAPVCCGGVDRWIDQPKLLCVAASLLCTTQHNACKTGAGGVQSASQRRQQQQHCLDEVDGSRTQLSGGHRGCPIALASGFRSLLCSAQQSPRTRVVVIACCCVSILTTPSQTRQRALRLLAAGAALSSRRATDGGGGGGAAAAAAARRFLFAGRRRRLHIWPGHPICVQTCGGGRWRSVGGD